MSAHPTDDEQHLGAVAAAMTAAVDGVAARLAAAREATGGVGQGALDRDQEVHRLTARLRLLRRYGADACLGRMVPADGSPATYVGRVGLSSPTGERLLVDWRTPAAEPFFAATPAHPMGLASRRRYRWSDGEVVGRSDELLSGPATDDLSPDDDSSFLAGLAEHRTSRMRDVLATIATDQDAAVRANSRGPLVVEGGPGTGKTVVALHRAAYLTYADPRLGEGRGGVLVVGPHAPYLAYVADVLPALGEDGVRTATLAEMVPEGAVAVPERDPEVARLKATAAMVEAIEPAVALYEEPPTGALDLDTPWGDVRLRAADWAEAFDAPEPGTPHNEARADVLAALAEVVRDRFDVPEDDAARWVRGDAGIREVLGGAWPLLEATDVVGDLLTVPAYLRRCAPHLSPDEVRGLQREDPAAWTDADLPLLDAARRRLGDPDAERRDRRRRAARTAEAARMDRVIEDLVAAEAVGGLMTQLRHADLRQKLFEVPEERTVDPDALAGPFAHVVVDEAQELTDAAWRMVLARCPSRSLTVVGDRAQARAGFGESWAERLERVGAGTPRVATLAVNYRTPEEVMAAAAPVIRAVMPDAAVPTSVRSTGLPVRYGAPADLRGVLTDWLAVHDAGTACVIGDLDGTELPDDPRLRHLSPALAKGLEFDMVVLVRTAGLPAVDRYVAMTRATRELVVLD